MGWKKIGKGLAKIAPIAAKVATSTLLGPGIASQITDALGLSKDASEDDVEKALATASPEQLVRIREINAETERHAADIGFKTRELETREEELHQRDRDSARKREAAVKDKTPEILAYGVCIALVILSCAIFVFLDRLEAASAIVIGLIASLVTGLLAALHQILSYYFGSSRGSAAKDTIIHNAINGGTK